MERNRACARGDRGGESGVRARGGRRGIGCAREGATERRGRGESGARARLPPSLPALCLSNRPKQRMFYQAKRNGNRILLQVKGRKVKTDLMRC